MALPYQAKKLLIFQVANLIVSIAVWLVPPIIVAGMNISFPLFPLKVLALIYFNSYPDERSVYSLCFFIMACMDVLLMFLLGSFSIYSFTFARVF